MTKMQLHLGDLLRSRRQEVRDGLSVLSVTMNDGLVRRDTLDRKTNGDANSPLRISHSLFGGQILGA